MGAMASQITSLTIVYSTVYSGADQSKHQSSASLAFVWGIHRGPVNSPHKWPVTRKMFPFDDVIMRFWIMIQSPLAFVQTGPLCCSKNDMRQWHMIIIILLTHWSCVVLALTHRYYVISWDSKRYLHTYRHTYIHTYIYMYIYIYIVDGTEWHKAIIWTKFLHAYAQQSFCGIIKFGLLSTQAVTASQHICFITKRTPSRKRWISEIWGCRLCWMTYLRTA